MNKPRYAITYWVNEEDSYQVTAHTIQEAEALYDMVGKEAVFKVLWDMISGEQLKET